jgi:hypothetical protein
VLHHELGIPNVRNQLRVEGSHLRDSSFLEDPLSDGNPIGFGLKLFRFEERLRTHPLQTG